MLQQQKQGQMEEVAILNATALEKASKLSNLLISRRLLYMYADMISLKCVQGVCERIEVINL